MTVTLKKKLTHLNRCNPKQMSSLNAHLQWDTSKKFGCIDVRAVSGKPLLTVNADLSGFAYYENGQVAACISCLKGYQFKSFFYAEDGTLIGCLDEKGLGFAFGYAGADNSSKPGSQFLGEKLVLTQRGCSYTPHNSGGFERITQQWRWNPNAQGAGTPPTEPIEIDMNESLRFKFVDRDNIFVIFRAAGEGLTYTFDCGQKLRRTDTYIQKGQRSTLFKGKIDLTVKTPSLIERFDEEERKSRLTKANVGSEDIKDPDIRAAMEAQERITARYKKKIHDEDFVDTFIGGNWRVDSMAKTVAEVPRLEPQSTEVGPLPDQPAAGIYALGTTTSGLAKTNAPPAPPSDMTALITAEMHPGFSTSVFEEAQKLSTFKFMQTQQLGNETKSIGDENEQDTRLRLQSENPKLPRPFVLRAASGRYTRDMPVDQDMEATLRLDELTPSNFDEMINHGPPTQLYVVLCYRADEQAHVWADQLMQYTLGTIAEASVRANGGTMLRPDKDKFPYRIGKFDMAQSAFLVRRYNVKSLPCYMAFQSSKLVTCKPMGGKAVQLTRASDSPHALLFEPDFASQIKTEKIMRKLNWRWDLCMSSRAAMSRSKMLADSGKHLGPERQDEYIHRAIFVNADVDPNEVRTVKQFLVRQGGGGDAAKKIVFVSMLKMGAVRLAGLPLDIGAPSPDGMPIACPRTGVVAGATEEHLIGNLCDVAVVKDIRRGTLNEIGRRCVLAAQLVKDLQVKARSGGEPGAPKEEVDGRHMGHTKSDLLKEFAEAKAAAGRGIFLPDGYQFGLQLTTKGSNFRGVDLGTKIKKSRRRR